MHASSCWDGWGPLGNLTEFLCYGIQRKHLTEVLELKAIRQEWGTFGSTSKDWRPRQTFCDVWFKDQISVSNQHLYSSLLFFFFFLSPFCTGILTQPENGRIQTLWELNLCHPREDNPKIELGWFGFKFCFWLFRLLKIMFTDFSVWKVCITLQVCEHCFFLQRFCC